MINSLIGLKIREIKSNGLGTLIFNPSAIFKAVPTTKKIENTTMVLVSRFFFKGGMTKYAISAAISNIASVINIDYYSFALCNKEFCIVPNPCVVTRTSTFTANSGNIVDQSP